ncbi:MAG: type II secretion system protein GspE [Candidatus Acididesulfobacter guangdongensis]|uniref:Type II secretion system protein GspE n=1 Tax=Acididesulfobacter guangdongensis TaxID=2597225 RepID=A0A519BFB5_ACIG2|nr:MAG: type II secretion system protein GspE [Candidatus Acididesulfobacter guangdongensis]
MISQIENRSCNYSNISKKRTESSNIGEMLVSNSLITREELDDAVSRQKLPVKPFIKILIDEGKIGESELVDFLSKAFCIDSVNINDLEIPKNIISSISPEMAVRFRVIPCKKENGFLYVATADPTINEIIDEISFYAGIPAQYLVTSYSQILSIISRYYNASFILKNGFGADGGNGENAWQTTKESDEISDISVNKSSAGAVEKYINKVISDAVEVGASDIHFEFYRKFSRIRFRTDGKLTEYSKITPATAKLNIISRIKNMANLDITEQRFPQDGRIAVSLGGHEVDIRVSCLPTMFGEKIVMRILNKSSLIFDINKIGFSQEHLKILKTAIHKPYGMILVTGPTGAGKTTTLYCILNELNNFDSLNISTAEDPIEYDFPGINQVQINEKLRNEKTNTYFNFAEVMRSFLRQDPDVIMVGEIRDTETALIAVQSALTGHLVLSTIHTNNASSTITRLINMKIENFLAASSLNLIIAQRLIRKLCMECKEELSNEAIKKLGIIADCNNYFKLYKAKGCPVCNNSGYKGRVPIYEMLNITHEISEMINNNATESEIEMIAVKNGMKTLSDSAKEKFFSGITSLEEIFPYLNKKID